MKKLLLVPLLALLVACGESVEVPPAYVGKVLTKNGYAPETITPSKFRLPPCMAYCDKLVLLETADRGISEQMVVFMPQDKLNLTVDVRGTLSVPSDKKTVNAIFDRVPSSNREGDGLGEKISLNRIYSTYGEQVIRGVVRSEITKYTIADILDKREAIGQAIHAAIAEKLTKTQTPIRVSRFELADVQPPKVIVDAQQAAKQREIAIQQAEADALVALVTAEKDLEIAKKNRLVKKEEALAIAEQNQIAAKSITPQLLAYRRLETAEKIMKDASSSKNPGLIVLPVDMSSFTGTVDDAAVMVKLLGKELKR